ncbi:MAG: hypothetical protein HQM00_09205 [Magnetococcales bacterium]|nr:hypothetical protein [Magnetococcales bacterium]
MHPTFRLFGLLVLLSGCTQHDSPRPQYDTQRPDGWQNDYQGSNMGRERIRQCIRDNGNAERRRIIARYCACMNEQMPPNTRKSISDWENNHPRAMHHCEREAGWR